MRRGRPIFLLSILGLSGYVAYTYRVRVEEIRKKAPKAPVKLPDKIAAMLKDWNWEKASEDGPKVAVKAKNFKHNQATNTFELEGLELKIYHKDGKTFDHITSDQAEFHMGEGYLYAEGVANITMGMADGQEPPPGRIIHIKSSGVRFDTKAGKAETERDVEFAFDRGEGRAVGATYDPTTRDLKLRSKVQLTWRDTGPNPRPMKIESEEVLYKENELKVYLTPWSRLSRGNMTIEGKAATVTLDKGAVRLVETTEAKGSDHQPGRELKYSADQLLVNLSDRSEIEKIRGQQNAKLVSTTEQGITITTTDAVEMFFRATQDSVLERVTAAGNTIVESKPIARPNAPQPDTRVLRSDSIELKMREGGREVAAMETQSAATLEFLPNRPGQKARKVEGDRFLVNYGEGNQIQSFRATAAKTRTENEPKQGKPQPPSLTQSKELEAKFDPKTGEMARLEQSGDFRYEEGGRQARAAHAVLENPSNRITLTQGARVWDLTGSTAADKIVMDQNSEDFRAEGNVTSSRMPEKKTGGSGMLSDDEPLQARAAIMTTAQKQSLVVYEGKAMLWQGSSRLEADRIEIDRTKSYLRATGKVTSQLQEKPKGKKPAPATPVFTVIQAPQMTYDDKERVAHYSGGATLKRGNLDVKAREIRSFMKEDKGEGSSLDKSVADGSVVIVSALADRTRRGTAEHAEYYTEDGKVILEQGEPSLDDTLRGNTRGNQLIYFANDDRLLVNGIPAQPAKSKIRRKRQ